MEEQLITFKTAKLAKKKGFPQTTATEHFNDILPYHEDGTRNIDLNYDGKEYSAVTQALLQKWLREKHNCFVTITQEFYMDGINFLWQVLIFDKNNEDCSGDYLSPKSSGLYGDNGKYKKYEDALEDGLKHALKKIK